MKTVFITGATDGIGLEMAKLYQARGYRLILLGRRPLGDLDPQLFRESNYLQADLDGDDYVELVESWLSDQGIEEVDLLIHNAGAGWVGKLAKAVQLSCWREPRAEPLRAVSSRFTSTICVIPLVAD